MSKNRDDATLRVYAALDEYERALDMAAKHGALLAAELPQQRVPIALRQPGRQRRRLHRRPARSQLIARGVDRHAR